MSATSRTSSTILCSITSSNSLRQSDCQLGELYACAEGDSRTFPTRLELRGAGISRIAFVGPTAFESHGVGARCVWRSATFIHQRECRAVRADAAQQLCPYDGAGGEKCPA